MRDEKEGRKKQARSKKTRQVHVHEDCVRISPGWEATLAIGLVRAECESGLLSLLHGQTPVIPTCVCVCVCVCECVEVEWFHVTETYEVEQAHKYMYIEMYVQRLYTYACMYMYMYM